MFFDSTILLIIPVFLLALYAQNKVQGTYKKYLQVNNSSGLTGAEVATKILHDNGIYDVDVSPVPGVLTDHYDPRTKEVHLSRDVFYGTSMSSISIAAHEVGHSIQHSKGYSPLVVRDNLVPVANLGSTAAFPMFFIGFLFSTGPLMDLGIIFFAVALLFHLVTLPVEFNASRRAWNALSNTISLTTDEVSISKKILNAAALTYVASALMALVQLIRLLILRGSRD